jgi:hypothetical protein
MAEKRLGIIMNGTEYEYARTARPDGTRRPATPMPTLDKGAK